MSMTALNILIADGGTFMMNVAGTYDSSVGDNKRVLRIVVLEKTTKFTLLEVKGNAVDVRADYLEGVAAAIEKGGYLSPLPKDIFFSKITISGGEIMLILDKEQ